MNFLQALIGQQAGTEAANDVANGINVFANRGQPVEEGPYQPSDAEISQYDALLMDNTEAIRKRKRAVEAGEAEADRRGMFGVKGTLRDVLGLVGDSFLMGQGKDPMYQARRDRERLSDAQAGFSINPRAAAERMGYYDPAAGREALNDYEQQELRRAQQQSLEDTRQSQIETRNYNLLKDGRALAQRILAQPGAFGPDGNLSPAAQRLLANAAQNAGTTVEGLIGQDMTPEALRLFGEADMTVNQQRNLPIQQQRANASTVQAAAADRRSRREPTPKQSRAKTDGERFDEFRAIPEGKRTRDQQDFIDDYVGRNKGSGGRRRPSGSTRSSGTSRPSVSNW